MNNTTARALAPSYLFPLTLPFGAALALGREHAAPKAAEAHVDLRLAALGLQRSQFGKAPLRIPALETRSCAALFPAAQRAKLETASLASFKQWIGNRDQDVPGFRHPSLVRFSNPPPASDPVWAAEDLPKSLRRFLECAGETYMFGDSRTVAEYRPIIERRFGPFPLEVFFAPALTIEPFAALRIERFPAALLVDHLTHHAGGQLIVQANALLGFGAVTKIEGVRREQT